MRYSRLLAWLLLVFVVAAVGAQLLRHALPHGGLKSQGVSRVASAAVTTLAGTVATGDQYVAKVKDHLARRIWETPDFQER